MNTENNEQNVVVNNDSIAKINISINEIELEPYKKQYIIEKQKHVVIRGFRKGKAPEKMVAKFFKDEAAESAKNNLIYYKYMKLLQEHKLQPLSKPTLEHFQENDGKMEAELSVEVLQPVVLGRYLGLELPKFTASITDDTINKTLLDIKNSYPKLEDVGDATTANNGNVAVINFSMVVNGKEFEKQENFKLNLGANLYFVEFENQIIGMKKNDIKEFDLTFPDTYQKEELKGKTVHFIVTVKSVHSVNSYTDDELSKLLGYESSSKMMETITKEITDKSKDDEHYFYETKILGQLLEDHKFKIPNVLIEDETKRILAEKPEMNKEQALVVADRFIRTDLILHAIYERHPELHMKNEEFEASFVELAAKSGDSIENTKIKLQKSGKLQSYVNYLTNCKVIDFLISVADFKEVTLTNEEK